MIIQLNLTWFKSRALLGKRLFRLIVAIFVIRVLHIYEIYSKYLYIFKLLKNQSQNLKFIQIIFSPQVYYYYYILESLSFTPNVT